MPDNVSLSGIPNFRLEVFENTGSAADRALSGRGLDHQFLHNAILCDERKALAASSHPETGSIELQAEGLRIGRISVCKHQYLAVRALTFSPGIHDEDIVYGHAGQSIDALRLEGCGVLNEPG